MNRQQAQRKIRETFEHSFTKERFVDFIRNLLNEIDDAPFTYQGNYIPDAYKHYIRTLERIGKFSDGENRIDILVIKLRKETSLERARTMQRNFIAWYLNGSRGGVMKDAALVAYVSPGKADWRFSLVRMDYKFEKTKTGKMKVKEEFTPARRWSFLVGENEKSHTAQSRLVNILENDKQDPTLKEIEDAFDIETVTKEFFLKYRGLFLRTKEELDKVVKKHPKVRTAFEARGVDTVNFAKKLLGQIVFLYFLQKKGWFGVGRDDDWGTGSKHFLRELFDKKHADYDNFFNDILEPLFYEALRIGEDRRHENYYYSRFNCKIPFLNGGLFDPIGNDGGYDWAHTDILLPNNLFSNTSRTKEGDIGDGILDIFDRYNFTVREDEPLEKEVAIDPELLGKAYEKFNAIRPDNYADFRKALKSGRKGEENKFNKKFGVYYTPREIVHYMCQQSLINYLNTELNRDPSFYQKLGDPQLDMFGNKGKKGQLDLVIEHKPEIKIKKEDIETLIHFGEQLGEYEETVLIKEQKINAGKQKASDYKSKLPESIRNNAALIDRKLKDITICDPAVGSGAFPVGMMSEIVRARNVLSTFIQDNTRTPYEFKRRCIEHSLYGVDIDPGAAEIAKLRLWLSLVVDEEDVKHIKPLPNLDYKILCGNSLLGVEKDLFNHQLFNELENLKPLYFNETNPTKKQAYKKQIDELISQVTSGHTEFDFTLYFSEVFHRKGGFDVVIANPPYVFARNSKKKGLKKEDKAYFYKKFELAEYQVNLYPLFIEQGYNLIKADGILSFITPNNWLTINTNKKLRRFVLAQSDVQIVNFYAQVFESAAVDSAILLFRKGTSHPNVTLLEYTDGFKLVKQSSSSYFLTQKDYLINIESFKNTDAMLLIEKIESHSVKMSLIADIKSGLMAYEVGKGNPAQTKEMKKSRVYHAPTKFDNSYFKYLDGKDVCRYYLGWSKEFLKYGNNLAAPRTDFRLFSTKRILVRQIPSKPPYCINACLIEEVALNDRNSMNIINFKESHELVLAMLNSKLISYWFIHKFGKMQRGTFPQFKVNELAIFPIPKTFEPYRDVLVKNVNQIVTRKRANPKVDTSDLEKQIDQLVYKLYDLTPEEIKIVEGENKYDNG